MGAPNASDLATGDHAAEPTAADQDQSGKRACVCRLDFTCLICRVTGHVVLAKFHLSGYRVNRELTRPIRSMLSSRMPTQTVCVHCDPPGGGRCKHCQAAGKRGRVGCRECQGSGYCGKCYGVGFEPTKGERITGKLLGLWWISWFGIISAFLLVGCDLLSFIKGRAAYSSILLLTATVVLWFLFYVATEKLGAKMPRDKNWHAFTLLSTLAGTMLAIFTLLGIVFFIYVAPHIR